MRHRDDRRALARAVMVARSRRTPVASRMNDRRRVFAIQATTIVAVLAAYEALARSHLLYAGVVPPLWISRWRLRACLPIRRRTPTSPSPGRNRGGFVVATVLGFWSVSWSARGRGCAKRWVRISTACNRAKIVFFPIAILLFGVGPASKAALARSRRFFRLR